MHKLSEAEIFDVLKAGLENLLNKMDAAVRHNTPPIPSDVFYLNLRVKDLIRLYEGKVVQDDAQSA